MKLRLALLLIITLGNAFLGPLAVGSQKVGEFHWFEYQGNDSVFSPRLPEGMYQNPILAGFHPDPSICRVGDDYYLVNSSFSYSPGLPIYHSRDLVNWRFVTHALESQRDLNFRRQVTMSRGIFAPTLRFHDGVFYLVSTAIDAGENFLITAKDINGPWSDPVWLPELNGGIDPDIFFDGGRVYIAHNGPPPSTPEYEGHRALWIWEFDLDRNSIKPESKRLLVDGGVDISQQPVWIEGPHLYKVGDWYYLSAAEGGTGDGHSQVVFRAKSLTADFEPYGGNPILTQRDLPADRPNPINATGHADLVETPDGDWWAVFLGVRNYHKVHFSTGRETFLLPIQWRDGWPTILPPNTPVPSRLPLPLGLSQNQGGAEPTTGNFTWRDNFDSPQLAHHWNFLRTSVRHDWYQINKGRPGIRLSALPIRLSDFGQPAFIGRRQQHTNYVAETALSLPVESGYSVGMAAFQSEGFHFYFAVARVDSGYSVFVEQVKNGVISRLKEVALLAAQPGEASTELRLRVEIQGAVASFSYQSSDQVITVLDDADATILSTQLAGGFVGSYIGLHTRIEGE
ncbi:glycoside hydrolase family 43 protein [Arenicella xantha]|uniref:Alpha-N-arabinofuranosidase n=1 Tax=Arenicella xantha TaxID=644221 RepID=A0A395JNP2_9GAMM|nr:glycoside hydrolase family 43 protein [Arenicella xantha]RBP51208.1 alpha-N-arabinofuranosidase [Arenicella xantha]